MEVLRAFQQLWCQTGSPPDVIHFISLHPQLQPLEILEILLADQQLRTAARLPDRLQDYLTAFPELSAHPAATHKLQRPTQDSDQTLVGSVAATAAGNAASCDQATQVVRHGSQPAAESQDALATQLQQFSGEESQLTPATELQYLQDRYRLDRLLGEGAFGRVYLGWDVQLERQVAVKLPNRARFRTDAEVDIYLTEARMAAALTHPGIVAVYDVGTAPGGAVYVVSQFINGSTLEGLLRAGRVSEQETAGLLSKVARALHAAHLQEIVHRDIKPANILIEATTGAPFVADFGLAIRADQQQQKGTVAGTPAYMSPEQALGEGHRLDGRSDIFSLGVILYEMLTDTRPFRGGSVRETLSQVITASPRPPRDFSSRIPGELERICLKALARRAADRYQTAEALAVDLEDWLEESSRGRRAVTLPAESDGLPITPRGLRSFVEEDAAFFLQLLPGPRNRVGLPESIAFWKQKLEEREPQRTFSVGVLYGSSGCGKSSLVRAGLLPTLAAGVQTIFLEATAENTEARLLNALRPLAAGLAADADAADACSLIRQRARGKVVLVLDQLEQWLSRNPPDPESILVRVLRQCDGGHLQSLLLVRDDFSVATARLMNAIEVPMLEGVNTALVDLFDRDHARRVLARFGEAWGRLPAVSGDWSDAQQLFLNQAVDGLAVEGRVTAVRLTLFAEMLRSREWTPQTLVEVGGLEGLGVAFLEDAFHSSHASPSHRLHAPAAREILKLLLPPAGLGIKGRSRSWDELITAAGYEQRPADFQAVLRILDAELRLITPVESVADSPETLPSGVSPSPTWQLAHDYLVGALREWLARKQRETRSGRAELLLSELTALWSHRFESRHLPGPADWIRLLILTRPNRWSAMERRMLRAASHRHLTRTGIVISVLLLAAVWLQMTRSQRQDEEMNREAAALADVRGTAIPLAVEQLTRRGFPLAVMRQKLERHFEREGSDERRLAIAAALARFGDVRTAWLVQQVENSVLPSSRELVEVLAPSRTDAITEIENELATCTTPETLIRKCRLALLALQLGHPKPATELTQATDITGIAERAEFIEQASRWGGFRGEDAAVVDAAGSPQLSAAVCLALAGVAAAQYSEESVQVWLDRARDWLNHPNATLHIAARRLLHRWAPQQTAATGISNRSAAWTMTSSGYLLLHVPAGQFRRGIRESDSGVAEDLVIPQPFRLAAQEVTLGQFLEFTLDPGTPDDQKPFSWSREDLLAPDESGNPVQKVSWTDAVLYCNWLSRREQLRPCYLPATSTVPGEPVDYRLATSWTLDPTADGYRLPYEAEWEWAVRCGQSGEEIPLVPLHLLDRYARFSSTSLGICGSLLPAANGFQDMLGNVAEWCQDVNPADNTQRVIRGGSYLTGPGDLLSRESRFAAADDRSDLYGFRIAQSMPDRDGR
ncbi:MAG: bifunctional serine/threonine-protein kinase/formylglycine-generating enzyme family protein [Planctomycetaceae bacterium]